MTILSDAERPAVTVTKAQPATGGEYAVLRWLVLATFVVILNETIMIIAIPRLMAEFDVTARAAQWLSTAFMLTMAAVIPATGWFLQRVTTRQAFALAMGVFFAGTALSAVAPAFSVLFLGRMVQAAGTAVMMPLLMTTLMIVVPEQDRGRVMGNVTLAISVAPALGPAVSGPGPAVRSWRCCSSSCCRSRLITVAGLRRLTTSASRRRAPRLVQRGAGGFGFGGLVYGLSHSAARHAPGWASLADRRSACGPACSSAPARLQRTGRRCWTFASSGPHLHGLVILMSVGFWRCSGR